MTGPRAYSGWKAGLLVVFITTLNLLGERWRSDRPPPDKVVTTVTPDR